MSNPFFTFYVSQLESAPNAEQGINSRRPFIIRSELLNYVHGKTKNKMALIPPTRTAGEITVRTVCGFRQGNFVSALSSVAFRFSFLYVHSYMRMRKYKPIKNSWEL